MLPLGGTFWYFSKLNAQLRTYALAKEIALPSITESGHSHGKWACCRYCSTDRFLHSLTSSLEVVLPTLGKGLIFSDPFYTIRPH